jgi:CBS domain-containing protein
MDGERTSVARLMTSGVLTVTTDTSVESAAETLREDGVGSLVVVDDENPVGVFTNTDLAEVVSGGESPADVAVAGHMTDEVVTIDAGDSIRGAAAAMIRNDVHHLPVTDDEEGVVGMLSTMDVTAYFAYTEGTDMV